MIPKEIQEKWLWLHGKESFFFFKHTIIIIIYIYLDPYDYFSPN